MARTCLIWLLCFTLVLLGASGLHGHLSDPSDAEHVPASEPLESHAHVVTVFDADHFPAHEHHGDIDIDPLTKAFGKGPLIQLFAAVLFVCGLVWLLNARLSAFRVASPPLRPPKVRFKPYFLPPSHAPPRAA